MKHLLGEVLGLKSLWLDHPAAKLWCISYGLWVKGMGAPISYSIKIVQQQGLN